MKKLLVTGVVIVFGMLPFSAFAAMDTVKFQESLNALNRLKPLQNPQYETSHDILRRNIIDQQNKVIGKIEDVLVLSDGGAVTSLQVSFDGLHLEQSVFLNYREMKIGSASNGYQLGLRGEEVAAIYPELLSNIETAAGVDNEILSVEKVIGQSVTREDGRELGAVQDVLFGNDGAQVQAVYVSVNSGIIRNVGVAIPLSALTLTDYHGRTKATLPNDQADLLLEFADKRK